MKKMIFVLILLFTFLAACSEDVQVITKENGYLEQTVKFDSSFTIENDENMKAEIILSDFQVEQGLSVEEENNEEYDFYTFQAKITNTGDVEVKEHRLKALSFDFYDENGKEIDLPLILIPEYNQEVFEPANLRPDGVNEGKIIITAPKGVTPMEMIYEENFMSIMGTDTYRFVFE